MKLFNGGITMKVSVGISNHHIHLTEEDLHILFGFEYELLKCKELNQPGYFASSATVTLQTEKSILPNVRVLGPCREYTQVELAMTDAHHLGIDPPVRSSGDIKSSTAIRVIGPKGSIDLEEGCIIATRHIHLTKEHMKLYHLEGKKMVDIFIPGIKGGILYNVELKVSSSAYFELHLDTDDANAHLLKSGDIVEIMEDFYA